MAFKRLSMIRGDSQTYTIRIKQHDGTPYCIKNWAITFTLKTNYDLSDAQASFQKSVTTFADSTAGTSGVAILRIEPADTINLDPGEYDYDIQVCTSDNKIYTVLRGKFELEYDVTRTAGTAGTS